MFSHARNISFPNKKPYPTSIMLAVFVIPNEYFKSK